MKKLLLVLAFAGLSSSAMAQSKPTCYSAPEIASAVLTEGVLDPDVIDVSLSDAGSCNATITKYAIEHTVEYYNPEADPAVDEDACGVEDSGTTFVTSKFTSPGAELSFSFEPTYGMYACGLGMVKVKALTVSPGKSNKSQNNPFSGEAEVAFAE